MRFDKLLLFITSRAFHMAIASAWKMLLYEGSGSAFSFISSSLKVISNPVCPFQSFEPSVKNFRPEEHL